MSRCTGACCSSIVLSHPREFLRLAKDRGDIEGVKIWTFMRPRSLDPDEVHVTCRALGSDGCQLHAGDRPSMCRDYPYGGDRRCSWCGAQSDAEARGVAIARVS